MIRSAFYFWTWFELYKQIICLGDENSGVTFSDSDQDGLQQFLSASNTTWSSLFRNKIKTQSIMRMIRCGGLGSLRTVAIWAALMVWGQINLNSLISWFPSFPKLSKNMGDGKWILYIDHTVSFFSVLWNYGHLDSGGWKYSFLYTAFGVLYTWFWHYIREGYVAVLAELGKFHLSHRDWI